MTSTWTIIFLILLFVELITINLVSIWFAIGALFSAIVSIFTDNILIQFLTFLLVSIVTLIITKPVIKKFNRKKFTPTNLDRVIGQQGVVTKRISKDSYGLVKVLGSIWTATSDDFIDVGSRVIVQKIDGVKLIVKKKED